MEEDMNGGGRGYYAIRALLCNEHYSHDMPLGSYIFLKTSITAIAMIPKELIITHASNMFQEN